MKDFVMQAVEALPELPATVVKFNDYVREHGLTMPNDEMLKILEFNEHDKKIVLEVAKSSLYNFPQDVELRRVVTLLGSITIKNILMAEVISNVFKFNIFPRDTEGNKMQMDIKCMCDLSPYGLNGESFLKDCSKELEVITTWLLAEDKQYHTLIPTIMLMRLGLIIFSQILIFQNLHEDFHQELAEGDFNNVWEVEKKFLGLDHIEFLEFLFERYKSDPRLISSLHHLKDPQNSPQELMKIAYIFNIVNYLFDPYKKITRQRLDNRLNLMQSLEEQGIKFKSALLEEKVCAVYYLE
ncbi:hypothetical protein DMB92_00720 [Campylobacter sp. MIT 99-7217]|uniref:hypothetical protein n=1 Tax=Campylobacter sp. MIT 99-7217 TaxID=535091 RepID=UPI001159E5EE|nr:hypothetical protein [Campylobacter sp. MIT 99-7217]TQR34519.1 hypothetical protein DMB92_00720 [Campylobacter sp. MIT 99-7217]